MKKIFLLLLSLCLVGCEKQLKVNQTESGYVSEEIASIEISREGIEDVYPIKPFLYKENMLTMYFDVLNDKGSVDSFSYDIDIKNKEARPGKIVPMDNEVIDVNYGTLVLETNDYRIFRNYENIVAGANEDWEYTAGVTWKYYYEKDGVFTLMLEWDYIDSTFDFNKEFTVDKNEFYNEQEEKGYLVYPASNELVVAAIQDGELEIRRTYPYKREGYVLSHVNVVDGEERVFYKGKNSMIFVHGEEIYEYSYKDKVLIQNDKLLISSFDELVNPIEFYVIDRKTQEKKIYEEFINVSDFQMLTKNRYYVNSTSNQTKDVYTIEDDLSITITKLPFTKQFEYIFVNDNQFVSYSPEHTSENYAYKFYLVTMEN